MVLALGVTFRIVSGFSDVKAGERMGMPEAEKASPVGVRVPEARFASREAAPATPPTTPPPTNPAAACSHGPAPAWRASSEASLRSLEAPVETSPKMEGRQLFVLLAPDPAKIKDLEKALAANPDMEQKPILAPKPAPSAAMPMAAGGPTKPTANKPTPKS